MFVTVNKKGVLLAELCITMAIVAIICSMTLTFTILLRQRTLLNKDRDNMLMYVSNVETGVKYWLTHYDNFDYNFSTANQGKELVATYYNDANKKYTLKLNGEHLVGDYFDKNTSGKNITYDTKGVTNIKFEIIEHTTGGSQNKLVKCDVSYFDVNSKSNKHTEFLFATHTNSSMRRKSN